MAESLARPSVVWSLSVQSAGTVYVNVVTIAGCLRSLAERSTIKLNFGVWRARTRARERSRSVQFSYHLLLAHGDSQAKIYAVFFFYPFLPQHVHCSGSLWVPLLFTSPPAVAYLETLWAKHCQDCTLDMPLTHFSHVQRVHFHNQHFLL